MHEEIIKKILNLALEEDLSPNGDISLEFIENSEIQKKAQIIAKEDGVMACAWIAKKVLEEYQNYHTVIASETKQSPKYKITQIIKEGEQFKKGQ